MEQPIFSFERASQAAQHLCPACGSKTIEVFATEYPAGPTGIYRCLSTWCDVMHVPSMPDVRP